MVVLIISRLSSEKGIFIENVLCALSSTDWSAFWSYGPLILAPCVVLFIGWKDFEYSITTTTVTVRCKNTPLLFGWEVPAVGDVGPGEGDHDGKSILMSNERNSKQQLNKQTVWTVLGPVATRNRSAPLATIGWHPTGSETLEGACYFTSGSSFYFEFNRIPSKVGIKYRFYPKRLHTVTAARRALSTKILSKWKSQNWN